MQKLAPGSRWVDGEKNKISDRRGYYISSDQYSKLTVRCIESGEAYTVSSDDALAIIDRANLDPVRVAARKLVDQIEKWKHVKPGFDDDEVVDIGSLEPELGQLKELL